MLSQPETLSDTIVLFSPRKDQSLATTTIPHTSPLHAARNALYVNCRVISRPTTVDFHILMPVGASVMWRRQDFRCRSGHVVAACSADRVCGCGVRRQSHRQGRRARPPFAVREC
ncbi:hypothetical protein E2C01_084454 [Portunus trituberculatus]|uniref:Uncharacterized protein n=1 Tax=Portunus trituberculatus TaxID=210409 RepID=A0A5B7J4V5_PORTR|nr:hypothetical protein [Portunus trituberculatus]